MNDALYAYLESALWASTDENEEPFDRNYDPEDFAPEAVETAREELEDFLHANEEDIEATGADVEQTAHDFWLTRNRHGAGFWDRGYGEAGERLTKNAHAYGSSDVYVGDDGKLYLS